MIIVLAIDALEYEKVEELDCKNIKLEHYNKTDISEFSQPRTMVLWSSFMTGHNKEKELLADGNKEMWSKKWSLEETFFSKFQNPCVLDLPGFSYDLDIHERSRTLLRNYFETKNEGEKKRIKEEYNKDAFNHHKKIKKEFIDAVNSGKHDFVLGYFSAVDVLGHLNFGNRIMMRMLYKEMDDLALELRKKTKNLLILSDHGMMAIGMFGDHSEYGFWSTNFVDLGTPKITEFCKVLQGLKNENRN